MAGQKHQRIEEQIDAMLADVPPSGSAAAIAAELDADVPAARTSSAAAMEAAPAAAGAPGRRTLIHAVTGAQLLVISAGLLAYSVLPTPAALLVCAALLIVDVVAMVLILRPRAGAGR